MAYFLHLLKKLLCTTCEELHATLTYYAIYNTMFQLIFDMWKKRAIVVSDENVAAVRKVITEEPHITYREIKATLEIGLTALNTILHEYLQVKKLCARRIPPQFN